MAASPTSDRVIYAVRFKWSESFAHMIGYAEDCFGPGSVIEFDLGPMRRFPCITDDGAHMLVGAEPRLIPHLEREDRQLGLDMRIERVWSPQDVVDAEEAIAVQQMDDLNREAEADAAWVARPR